MRVLSGVITTLRTNRNKILEKMWKSDFQNQLVIFPVTAWQALLLVNLKVGVTHDWLIEWNGTVYGILQ